MNFILEDKREYCKKFVIKKKTLSLTEWGNTMPDYVQF